MSFWDDFGGFLGGVADKGLDIYGKAIDLETSRSEQQSAQVENNFLRELLGVKSANAATGSSAVAVPTSTTPTIPPIVLYGGIGLLAYLALKK